jgi:hypothetical protein
MPMSRRRYNRLASLRLKGYDYSRDGFYLITLGAYEHADIFGEIKNAKMHLNTFGAIADSEWQRSFKMRPGLLLDCYQIMPNHMHAIVIIKNSCRKNLSDSLNTDSILRSDSDVPRWGELRLTPEEIPNPINSASSPNSSPDSRDRSPDLISGSNIPFRGEPRLTPTAEEKPIPTKKNPIPKPGLLSKFIGGYKSTVTVQINRLRNRPGANVWQISYWDHIIRNEKELLLFREYIKRNPAVWDIDRENRRNRIKKNFKMD